MKNYQALKNQTYKQYKILKPVFCPYLKTRVGFTSQGFWHMIYRSRNNKRPLSTQILRFKLLNKVVQLLRLTATIQEYQEAGNIEYFGFIAILEGWKISVIPNWVTNNKRDRLLHKGDLKED